ncbi:CLUMA_CG003149, isoform A [Clunio marinus]|uniref:CLUMA_CG003149, isoform A n=1 Tax=Clunio marinus TaxID=568069 RepID=A0A1J1HSD8_9DIPT|nr:CLUMA_CG003149, isoform A [Clunio marinus]
MSGKSLSIIFLFVLSCYQSESAEVRDKFIEEKIVPDVLDDIPDIAMLSVNYPSGVTVELGNVLTPTQVKDKPTVEWTKEDGVYYTLLMTDPDAPTRENPTLGEIRHWLVVNINNQNVGETIVEYRGSAPPMDTGLHRYIFLLFKQIKGYTNYDIPFVSDRSFSGRPNTSTKELMDNYDLELVAGSFYQAEYDDYVPILQAQLLGKTIKCSPVQ